MSVAGDDATLWKRLARDSASGVLVVDRQVAFDCAAACTTLIDELMSIRHSAHVLTSQDAYGSLGSGLALRDKFNNKAMGESDSLVSALQSHIDVVTLMKTVFENSIRAYEVQDSDNAQLIADTDR